MAALLRFERFEVVARSMIDAARRFRSLGVLGRLFMGLHYRTAALPRLREGHPKTTHYPGRRILYTRGRGALDWKATTPSHGSIP